MKPTPSKQLRQSNSVTSILSNAGKASFQQVLGEGQVQGQGQGKKFTYAQNNVSLSSSQPLPGRSTTTHHNKNHHVVSTSSSSSTTAHKSVTTSEKLDDMPRRKRLLVMALQIPQVDNLLRDIAYSRYLLACQRKFTLWKTFTIEKRREEEVLHMIKQMMATTIQKIIRGKLSKNRVQRIRKKREEFQNQRYQYHLQLFQRIIRQYCWKIQWNSQIVKEYESISLDYAARTIQRCFRGYLGRGQVILIERKKLLKYLRQWSHGLTNHLYHLTDLQDAEPLAVIHTAISFTTLPSKPIRNLPTLSKIKQYRAGLYILFWQVRSRYHRRKVELQQIVKERQLMRNEELLSLTREIVARVHADKIRLQRQQVEMMLKREQLELERRKNFQAAQFLSDIQNKKQQGIREEQERIWRNNKRQQDEDEFIRKQFQLQLTREQEMMTFEDQYAHLCHQQRKAIEEQQRLIQEEKQTILSLQEKLFFHQSTILPTSSLPATTAASSSSSSNNNKNKEPVIEKEVVKLVNKQNKYLYILYQDLLSKFHDIDLFFTDSITSMLTESLGLNESFVQECKTTLDQFRNSWIVPTSSLGSYVHQMQQQYNIQVGGTRSYNQIIDTFVREMLKTCHFNYSAVNKYLTTILKEAAVAMKSTTKRKYRPTRRGTVDLLVRNNRKNLNALENKQHGSHSKTNHNNHGPNASMTSQSSSSIGPYRLRYEMFEYLYRFVMALHLKSVPSLLTTTLKSNLDSANPKQHTNNGFHGDKICGHPWQSLLTSKQIIANCQWIVEEIDIPCLVLDNGKEINGSDDAAINTAEGMSSSTLPFLTPLSRGVSSIAASVSDRQIAPKVEHCKVAYAHACNRRQLIQYKEYLQYRYLTKKCSESQQALIYAIHQFEIKHNQLESLRKEKLQKGKLTLRSQRKEILEEAIKLENELEDLRKELIFHASYLTDFMYFLVRMMLDIFFSSHSVAPKTTSTPKSQRNLNKDNDGSISHTTEQDREWFTSERVNEGWGGIETFSASSGLCVYHMPRPHRSKSRRAGSRKVADSKNIDYKSDSESSTTSNANKRGPGSRPNTSSQQKHTNNSGNVVNSGTRANSSNSKRRKKRRKSRTTRKSRFGFGDFEGDMFDSLAFRKFDIEKEDHDQYWRDLFDCVAPLSAPTQSATSSSNHHSRWQGITALDLLRLPAPPIPMYQHDGRRHHVKVITSTSIKKKFSSSSKRSATGKYRSVNLSVSVTSTSIFASAPPSIVTSPRSGKTGSGSESSSNRSTTPSPPKQRRTGNPLLARLSNKFDKRGNSSSKQKATVQEKVKEQKFYDIPGENLFLEAAITDYDFYHWSVEVDAWTRDCLEFVTSCENEWKRKQMHESFPSFATEMFCYYHRYQYLAMDHHEYENTPETMETAASASKSSSSFGGLPSTVDGPSSKFWDLPKIPSYLELQNEQTNCAIMNKIALAKAVDLLEFQLLKSDMVIGMLSDVSHKDDSAGLSALEEDSKQLVPKKVIPIPGNVLEATIGRQSSSLYLKMLLENKIRQEEKISFSSFHGLVQRTSTISHRNAVPTWDEVIMKNNNDLLAGFDRGNICSLLNCIQKEREELKDSLKTIVKNEWLKVEKINSNVPAPDPTAAAFDSMISLAAASWDNSDHYSGKYAASSLQTRTWDSYDSNPSNDDDDRSQTSLQSLSTSSISLRLAIPLSQHAQPLPPTDPIGSSQPQLPPKTIPSVDYNIDCSQSTEHTWLFYFPLYMYPILRFGNFCGKESFFKRLQREKQRKVSKESNVTTTSSNGGGMNVYSLIDEIDERSDQIARIAFSYMSIRKQLKKELLQRIQYRLNRDEMFLQMKYEDSRSHIMRFDEKEKKRLQELEEFRKSKNKKSSSSVFDCCLPLFNRSYAKIHVSQMTPIVKEHMHFLQHVQPKQRNQSLAYQQWRLIVVQLEKIVREFQERSGNNKPFLSIFEDPSFLSFCDEHRSKLYDEYNKPLDLYQLERSLRILSEQCLDPTHYFRQSSWITGQRVYLNEHGEHFNAVEMIYPKLSSMSSIYDDTNSALHLAPFAHKIKQEQRQQLLLQKQRDIASIRGSQKAAFSGSISSLTGLQSFSSSQKVSQSWKYGNSRKYDSPSLKSGFTNKSKGSATNKEGHVREAYIAGSLQKVLILLRVVEDEMVTDRGNIVLESFDREDIRWIDQLHDLTNLIPSALISDSNTTPQGPAKLEHIHHLYADKLALLRSGFQCFPVSDGDRRSYAQCLAVDHRCDLGLTTFNDGDGKKSNLRYMSFENYKRIYGHNVDFNQISLFKDGALPSINIIWRDLPVTVFRKRYLSVTNDYRVLTGIKKLQAVVRGALYRQQNGIEK